MAAVTVIAVVTVILVTVVAVVAVVAVIAVIAVIAPTFAVIAVITVIAVVAFAALVITVVRALEAVERVRSNPLLQFLDSQLDRVHGVVSSCEHRGCVAAFAAWSIARRARLRGGTLQQNQSLTTLCLCNYEGGMNHAVPTGSHEGSKNGGTVGGAMRLDSGDAEAP